MGISLKGAAAGGSPTEPFRLLVLCGVTDGLMVVSTILISLYQELTANIQRQVKLTGT